MKKLLVTLMFLLSTVLPVQASSLDVFNQVLNSYLIESNSNVKMSMLFNDDYSPAYSLQFFKPRLQSDGCSFLQAAYNSQTNTANFGFGIRFLKANIMTGLNVFYDQELNNNHARGSVGVEVYTPSMVLRTNYYKPMSSDKLVNTTIVDQYTTRYTYQKVLEGFDVELGTNSKNLNLYASIFSYDKVDDKNYSGYTLRSELALSDRLTLEAGYTCPDGKQDYIYSKIMYDILGRKKSNSVLKNNLIAPVIRSNDICYRHIHGYRG